MACSEKCRAARWRQHRETAPQHRDDELRILALAARQANLAVRIEHEFFGDDAFTEMAKERFRRADRFAVEERVQRLSEQLMPLFDRANRMMIRNLKAIKELRQGQVPAIAIGRADQVTVTNRPPGRLRPVKTELPPALLAQGMSIAPHDRIPARHAREGFRSTGFIRHARPTTDKSLNVGQTETGAHDDRQGP